MSIIQRIFGETRQRAPLQPLYRAIVAKGREPAWYRDGLVPDTIDGRFDMIASLLALVLLRLEVEGESGKGPSVLLTEIFIDDMDGTLRQLGIGDYVVGKHVGRMMSALGGRIAAYRAALGAGGDLREALTRNLYRGAAPAAGALDHVEAGLRACAIRLGSCTRDRMLAGDIG